MIRLSRRALVAALALPFLVVSTTFAQPAEDGFLGRRKLLKELSQQDQKLLARLILDYTTANGSAVVKVHEKTMSDPKLHSVHQAPYTQLFSWHRTYIEGLETFLKSKGQSKFVPLPKWIPSDPIPYAFQLDKNGQKIVKNANPKHDWTKFHHSKLGAYRKEIREGAKDTTPNKLVLADTLVVPHNDTHNTIGGTMSSMSSPAVPIFWCYHAFIDDIGWDYEHIPKSKDPIGAPLPEGTTTIGGEITLCRDGCCVVVKTPAGDFEVTNEPFCALLKDLVGRTVYLQAKIDGKRAIVESVTGLTEMDVLNVRDASGKFVGQIGTMAEVRITGTKGTRLEIEHEGKKGFIAKSGVTIGTPSTTTGLTGAMNHGHDHGHHDHE
ncbi:MAG: tyrosinase family protein [Planctomycetota bacterium]